MVLFCPHVAYILFSFCLQDRTTVMVDAPFLGVCGAVHMEELMQAIGVEDPLGLRERLLIVYDRPRFVRAAQLQAACERIPCNTLHEFLAKHFWQLHCVHHPGHAPKARFVEDLNYKWLHYSWEPAAATLFWDNFDERAGEQEAAYRVDQQAAKKAGKWKTRHFRLALPLHNLSQACVQTSAENWQFEVSEAAAKASVVFSSWMDAVFSKLDLLRGAAQSAGSAASGEPPPSQPSPRDDLRAVLGFTSIDTLLASGVHFPHLHTMMLAVLESTKKPLVRHVDVTHLPRVLALNLASPLGLRLGARTLKALSLLGFGTCTLSVNPTGTKVLWFTKVPDEDWPSETLNASRTALQIPPNGFNSWPRARMEQAKQKSQAQIIFPNTDDPDFRARVEAAAAQWTAAAAAAAAPPVPR